MAKEGKTKREHFKKPESEFDQRIIDLARVTRVMAGGKRMRFRACVVIGDKKGKVGWSVAKGADVTIAVNKAVAKAKKYMVHVKITNETIPHQVEVKFKAAKILLKPASKGTGIIAGGAVRSILELSGIPNIYGKILGSNNKINNIHCVFEAFKILNKAEGLVKTENEELTEEQQKDRDLEKEEELEKEQEKLLRKIKESTDTKLHD